MKHTLINADVIDGLRKLPDKSVQSIITSPPYWGLRDYGIPGQIGLEPTLQEYLIKIVEVFRETKRVLRDDGTLWINIGDKYQSYNSVGKGDCEKLYLGDSDYTPILRKSSFRHDKKDVCPDLS